jgi:hypothetical protein
MTTANPALYVVRRDDVDTWQLAAPSGPLTRPQKLPQCLAEAARLSRRSPVPDLPVWRVADFDAHGRWDGSVSPSGEWAHAVSLRPFAEFSETSDRDGVAVSVLECPELPAGYYCVIRKNGRGFQRKTRADGNGSIRYHSHPTLEDARAAAVKWARRKVAEAKR